MKNWYILLLLPLIAVLYTTMIAASSGFQFQFSNNNNCATHGFDFGHTSHSEAECHDNFNIGDHTKYSSDHGDCQKSYTLVDGRITNQNTNTSVGGANVTVTCTHVTTTVTKLHNGTKLTHTNTTVTTRSTTSLSSPSSKAGFYSVTFPDNLCEDNDHVTVTATSGGMTGIGTGIISDSHIKKIDFALVNVSLIPEFGFFVGALTLFGAAGLFLAIRKK